MRKGQAALEFLTTYGWAFLIILVMIGAISYFGILNPAKLLPSRCTISSDLDCFDYKIDTTGLVSLELKQAIGKTIFFNNMTCTYEGQTVDGTTSAPQPYITWPPRNTMSVSCTVPKIAGLKKQKVKVMFDVTYQKSTSGLTHISTGEVYAEVQ